MISLRKAAAVLALAALACVSPLSAQAPKKAAPAPATPAPAHSPTPQASPAPEQQAAQPPAPGWISRCNSATRDAPLECAVEETAVLTKTGQLIVLVNIRVRASGRTPPALVRAGAVAARPQSAGRRQAASRRRQGDRPADPDLRESRLLCQRAGLAGASGGAEIRQAARVAFQNLNKEVITIPMLLADFAAGRTRRSSNQCRAICALPTPSPSRV